MCGFTFTNYILYGISWTASGLGVVRQKRICRWAGKHIGWLNDDGEKRIIWISGWHPRVFNREMRCTYREAMSLFGRSARVVSYEHCILLSMRANIAHSYSCIYYNSVCLCVCQHTICKRPGSNERNPLNIWRASPW